MEAAARRMPTYPPYFSKRYSQWLDNNPFVCYIVAMKTRNIINVDNEDSREPFAVYQHIILKNGWEYYLEEEDNYG